MKKQIEKYVTYNLRETYHEFGRYEFKIVLSPKHFKNGHMSEVSIVDCAGRPVETELKKWGRKINCTFLFDDSVEEGVCNVSLLLKDDERSTSVSGSLRFWTIKPQGDQQDA